MIDEKEVRLIRKKMTEEKLVDQGLANGGILHIEKTLPYICVYRFDEPDAYFEGLLRTQASYLIAHESDDISKVLEVIATAVSEKLNAFLIIEMWPVRHEKEDAFQIFCPEHKAPATLAALVKGFDNFQEIYPVKPTKTYDSEVRHPRHLLPLLNLDESKESGSLVIGVAIPTIYEIPEEREVYSLFYRKFYQRFSETIRRAAYEFIRVQTSNPFKHYLMLGKTLLDKVTLKADSDLAKISEGMSFLLRTTPVNSTGEWRKFEKSNFSKPPAFNYRLITIDPELKKRKLYELPIDQVEDPTLAFILRDKRLEIEKQLTMLEERGTDNFRHIGASIYGNVENHVSIAAQNILLKFPEGKDPEQLERLDCHTFAAYAQRELQYYQQYFPNLKLSVEIRKDVAGIMVSKSKLLVTDQLSLDASRCDALIQHEIGTHILTYCNGKSQPIKQMYAGFAGYDSLQEGLAVLTEYLVDGLTVNRIRLLAGRVVAAESMLKGDDFITTFNLLTKNYNFPSKIAYYITMRVYRGGGLVKDAVYLAGLMNLMKYLQNGGQLELLYMGKFNIDHVDLVEELRYRNVLKPPILPKFLKRKEVQIRLQKVVEGLDVTNLLASS